MGKEEQMRGLVNRWAEHCNSIQNVDGMEKYLTADYKWHVNGRNVNGLENVKQVFKNLLSEQEFI
jgi:NADPH-dependent curcumin reductase CurA